MDVLRKGKKNGEKLMDWKSEEREERWKNYENTLATCPKASVIHSFFWISKRCQSDTFLFLRGAKSEQYPLEVSKWKWCQVEGAVDGFGLKLEQVD